MIKIIRLITILFTISFAFISCERAQVIKPIEQPKKDPPKDDNGNQNPIPDPNPDPDNFKDIKVLTLNTWGLPSVFTKDLKERMSLISTSLDGFDIVNLQETFSKDSKVILDKANYPYKIRVDNGSFLAANSGLTTLSKHQVITKGFEKFPTCTGSDCTSNKGVLFVRVKIPEIGEVDIYNTHYQAGLKNTNFRISDNKTVESFLKKNDKKNLTFLTGDFNFIQIAPDYTDFLRRFSPIDSYRQKNPSNQGYTYDKTLNNYADKDEPQQRLDYIFMLRNSNLKVEVFDSKLMFTNQTNGKFLSDHFGVLTTFRVYL